MQTRRRRTRYRGRPCFPSAAVSPLVSTPTARVQGGVSGQKTRLWVIITFFATFFAAARSCGEREQETAHGTSRARRGSVE